jgi:hypothetical protein
MSVTSDADLDVDPLELAVCDRESIGCCMMPLSTLYPLPQEQIFSPGRLDELGDLGLGNPHRTLL